MSRYLPLLGLCLCLAPTHAADVPEPAPAPRPASDRASRVEQERPLAVILARMDYFAKPPEAYTIEYRIKKTGETHTIPEPTKITHTWLIGNCFAASGNGDIVATITFEKEPRTYALVSKGLPEDLFVVRELGLQKKFAKWYEVALAGIPESKDVVPYERKYPDTSATDWVRVEKPTEAMQAAVKVAKEKYDEKRAELMKRFNRSIDRSPFYAPAEKLSWHVAIRDKTKTLHVSTGCRNRTVIAYFDVEFAQADDGSWRYVKLIGQEVFVGE
jgi:hypothetical protein